MRDDALAERIEADYESSGVDERRLAMLRYVDKLTRSPNRIQQKDIESLRSMGFDDVDILAIAEVAAYYAYVNRLADGLGVDLEG